MKILPVFIFLITIVAACHSAKRVGKTQPVTATIDTTPEVTSADNGQVIKNEDKKTDSASGTKDVFDKITKNRIDFSYFNAKVRVQYSTNEGEDEATAYVRLKKDSVLWLSMRGALGIEGFRVLITTDSVKILNLLKKNVQFRGIEYLQEVTGIPLNFATLQDLVVGNPVFIDSNVVGYKVGANNEVSVLMNGRVFRHLLTLDKNDYRMLQSKLDDIEIGRNRACEITFSNYDNSAGVLFSTARKMSVADQSKLNLNLDFKQYTFNQPLTFPFNIPKNYKRL